MAPHKKAAANPYAHLKANTKILQNPTSEMIHEMVEEAAGHTYALTGIPIPVTEQNIISQTYKEAAEHAPHIENFKAALASGNSRAALEHYVLAQAAQSLAANEAEHVNRPSASTQEKDLLTLVDYVRNNLNTAREIYNGAATIFSHNFNDHLSGLSLSTATIMSTKECRAAYAACAKAKTTLSRGYRLLTAIPNIFDCEAYPENAHLLTKGHALPATIEENPRYVFVEPEERVYGTVPPKADGVPVIPITLEFIASTARLLGGIARPGEIIRLYWATPQELQEEHDEFLRMQETLGGIASSDPNKALTYWARQGTK